MISQDLKWKKNKSDNKFVQFPCFQMCSTGDILENLTDNGSALTPCCLSMGVTVSWSASHVGSQKFLSMGGGMEGGS